ncbi:MAG: T9SS type A sorting domain-containing protein, partial [Flavobacteriales bacterium]|nr:T9SS type A sorting domain-containing protein [Flavobacteriales bacterium]
DLIEITTLFPNPASSHATLTVTVKEDLSAKVQLFTMDGALVEQVFDGQLYEGWPTTLELDVNNLESGMYQVRVSSKNFVTTKKLLVIE